MENTGITNDWGGYDRLDEDPNRIRHAGTSNILSLIRHLDGIRNRSEQQNRLRTVAKDEIYYRKTGVPRAVRKAVFKTTRTPPEKNPTPEEDPN